MRLVYFTLVAGPTDFVHKAVVNNERVDLLKGINKLMQVVKVAETFVPVIKLLILVKVFKEMVKNSPHIMSKEEVTVTYI